MLKRLNNLLKKRGPVETGEMVLKSEADNQCRKTECYGYVNGASKVTQFFMTFFQDNQEAQQEKRRKLAHQIAQDLKQSKNSLGDHSVAAAVDDLLPLFDIERGTELLRQRQQTKH